MDWAHLPSEFLLLIFEYLGPDGFQMLWVCRTWHMTLSNRPFIPSESPLGDLFAKKDPFVLFKPHGCIRPERATFCAHALASLPPEFSSGLLGSILLPRVVLIKADEKETGIGAFLKVANRARNQVQVILHGGTGGLSLPSTLFCALISDPRVAGVSVCSRFRMTGALATADAFMGSVGRLRRLVLADAVVKSASDWDPLLRVLVVASNLYTFGFSTNSIMEERFDLVPCLETHGARHGTIRQLRLKFDLTDTDLARLCRTNPTLEYLDVDRNVELTSLVPVNGLRSLRYLSADQCPKLVQLPEVFPVFLQTLSLTAMAPGLPDDDTAFFRVIQACSHLDTLSIRTNRLNPEKFAHPSIRFFRLFTELSLLLVGPCCRLAGDPHSKFPSLVCLVFASTEWELKLRLHPCKESIIANGPEEEDLDIDRHFQDKLNPRF